MFLAVDAGGTSTRAVTLTGSGQVLARGRAGSGNPTAAGIEEAVAAILAAAPDGPVSGPGERLAVVAMAGEQTARFAELLAGKLAGRGWGRVILEHDLLAIFCSGTPRGDGYALIAGTGTVAARVVDGRLARVVGGRGWLLGDAGGGFWVGQRVARAVVAALDGQRPPTALTDLVLDSVGLAPLGRPPDDPARALRELVSALYARRPVQLAELAPLAFAAAADGDPTAREIVVAATQALADLVAAVRVPGVAGPLVGGGSVLVRGVLGAPADLARELVPLGADLVPVPDGVVGAAVLTLRHAGLVVGATEFRTLQAEVARARP